MNRNDQRAADRAEQVTLGAINREARERLPALIWALGLVLPALMLAGALFWLRP